MTALKHLPHRQWDVLRDLWIDHLPDINFPDQMPEPTLWHLPELKDHLHGAQPGAELPYVEGARQSVFREAVILARKFAYCRMAALEATKSGLPTWGVVSGYDACFYGAKALCYFLGIASVNRDSKLFVDLFASRTHKVGRSKSLIYDIFIVHRLDERLTHKTLWDLTGRLCRTLSLPEAAGALNAELRGLNLEGMANLRNNIIYDGGFWLESEDMGYCDLLKSLSDLRLFHAIGLPPPANATQSERYFAVAHVLHRALLYFLEDIARLAPAIRGEVAALAGWRDRALQ